MKEGPQSMAPTLSIILPAKNEAGSLSRLLPEIRRLHPGAEVLVINDGSTDETSEVCAEWGVREIGHPYSQGNGAAVKSGARHASGETLVFMDADGQHSPVDIARLLAELESGGYDMVVGARNSRGQANPWRGIANRLYNQLASWMVGHRVRDLTSGFRAVRADRFREFLHLLPNGFSYPTTITMAFFRAGHPVSYLPIEVAQRTGKSHLRPIQDGIRFLLIIFRIGTLYSPLKMFVPISFFFFILGLGYYAFTFFSTGRLSQMTVFLLTSSVIIFLIGLVSEQITNLTYRPVITSERDPS